MNPYFLFVQDDRYTVPTLDTINARDDEQAIAHAARRLAASPHYRAIEIWEDERLVAHLTRADLDQSAN